MKHHSGARHRARTERATAVGVIPLAIAITCAGPAFAQPGVMVPEAEQPGVVAESAPEPVQEAEPVVDEPKTYWIAPPAEYAEVPTRPVPTYEYTEYTEPVAPVQIQELHLPVAVEVVAPIEAPKERLRIGDFVSDQPNWLSDEYLNRTNNTSSVIEAQVNTFWKSIGVDAERSDRIAAATVGGAASGAVTGALALGVPAATVGGLVGGTIGGIQGAGVGLMLPNPIPGLASIPTGVAGTAAGAAIGAAAAGIPAAAAGAVIGGVAGGLTGTAFGAGDSLGTPTEFVLPSVTEPDAAALKLRAGEEYARLAIEQPAAATAVVDAVVAAPQLAEQVTGQAVAAREATLAQPGGEQVIAGLDAAAVELNHAFGPVAGMVGEALAAGRDGLAV
ncbi:insoluble domain protein [Rhodococcus daqingensis]|uniref:Insoluble domain protein n=1 Tax=Rhodococcus daqingensis TaxID=2479363 RepID=A0ABW2RWV8_9NOCA